MKITERIEIFENLFDQLKSTNSRNEKEYIINIFITKNKELKEDLNYIFETLTGKHPIGWKYCYTKNNTSNELFFTYTSIKQCIKQCVDLSPKTMENIKYLQDALGIIGKFIEPIVNRELKLGIANSQLEKSDLTPMLAKKYEGQKLNDKAFITEKLDGNRCIAHYDGTKWCFTSRSGKLLNVNFNMGDLPTEYIYDGEIMSDEQTYYSTLRYYCIKNNEEFNLDTQYNQLLFNKTSGLINRLGEKSGLKYNIFDIICNLTYIQRRNILDSIVDTTCDIRILPVLGIYDKDETVITDLLDKVVKMGGEGVMLNLQNRHYEHKRTDALLKYKQVQTVDMRVLSIKEGTGKYEGQVGSLNCYIQLSNGKQILCDVGSGLTDEQRMQWTIDETEIVGKIVEVGYHELTQDKEYVGTNIYSLRFPRLLKIREDKKETSEF